MKKTLILFLTVSLILSLCACRKTEPESVQGRTNEEWEHLILAHKTAVSDTVQFTSGHGSNSCFDPAHGKIYATYHASRTGYGETDNVLALAVIPVAQPYKAETFIIAEDGMEKDGIHLKTFHCSNAIFINGIVRICFLNNGTQYYYVDFDPQTNTFSPIRPMQLLIDGAVTDFHSNNFKQYLRDNGIRDFTFEANENMVLANKIYYHDGYWYTALTSSACNPVIVRSADGITYEPLSVMEKAARYECGIAIVNGRMYALLRGALGDNFYVSDDLGRTFKSCGKIDFAETRMQLVPYRGKLLIALSENDVEPNLVRNGRNNMKLLWGEGEDLSAYREIFRIVDPYGIVSYDIVDYKGVLYMAWSNADLYVDKIIWDSVQAKDVLYFSKIGDLSSYME